MLFHLNVCNKGSPALRRNLLVLLTAAALNLFVIDFAHAADYYMSPSGNDSNPGTLAAPWKSFDRLHAAQKILKPGDTVYFRGGDYVINDSAAVKTVYQWWAAGTASAPVIYRNYQGEKPVIVFDRRNITRGLMLGVYGDYTIIDGLHFRQTEESSRVSIVNNAYINKPLSVTGLGLHGDNMAVRNCSIENFSSLGIFTDGGNLLFENCMITGGGNHNFYIAGPNGTYRYNHLDGTRHVSEGARTIQIQYKEAVGNKIYGNFVANGRADGIVFSGPIRNNEVFNNVFLNAGTSPRGAWVVSAGCWSGPTGSGNKFYNNTVIGKSTYGLISANRGGTSCPDLQPATKIEIYNNIFYPSTPVRVGLQTPNVRNNIFYNVTGPVPPGNLSVNPMLANSNGTTSADAMLTAGSPAIDKAISPFPINDYQGGKRPFPAGGAADIGAFEFGAPPGEEKGPLGGGSFPPSGPVLLGPNGEVCPTGYLPSQ